MNWQRGIFRLWVVGSALWVFAALWMLLRDYDQLDDLYIPAAFAYVFLLPLVVGVAVVVVFQISLWVKRGFKSGEGE